MWHCLRDITTFDVYLIASDLEKLSSFEQTAETTGNVRYSIHI